MSGLVDQPRAPRDGEAIDVERLAVYLRGRVEIGDAPLEVLQFPGGHSNLTYLLRAGEREWVLRRPPFGTRAKTAHDMSREHRVLSGLVRVWPRVPRPVLFCDDESVIGAEFYLTERAKGLILRRDLPEGLDLDEHGARRLSETLVDTLVELHAVEPAAAGLSDFGRPDGYVSRQVEGWARRYANARTDDIPDVERVASWLSAHVPVSPPPTLVHNDFKYDNLVLDPGELGRVVAVLDWEMSTVGDPLSDLGTALAYWVEPSDEVEVQAFRMGPTHLEGSLTREGIAQRYSETSGRDVSDVVFYYALGLFKVAVVAQQIYQRFAEGASQDPRFAIMIVAVRNLAAQALRAIDRGAV